MADVEYPPGPGYIFFIDINIDIMGSKNSAFPNPAMWILFLVPMVNFRLQVDHPSGLLNGRSDYWVERFPKFKHFCRTV